MARGTHTELGKGTAYALGAAFVLSVFLPLSSAWLGWPAELPNFEKRELAERPSFLPTDSEEDGNLAASLESIERYPRAYELWHDDHFGLRSHLIRSHNILKSRVLKTPPNEEVVIGKDGWLYFAGQLNIEQYRAVTLMSPELAEGWRRYLAIVREWVEDHGADYLLVIGPSKPTIYPEHLPDTIRAVGETTRLDQFVAELEAEGEQWFLDLREVLLAAKEDHLTYQKTDTHWNSFGSFVSTGAIVDELIATGRYDRLAPLSTDDFAVREREQEGGDIAELMGLTDLFPELDRVYEPREAPPYRWSTEGLPPGEHPFHEPYVAVYDPARLPAGGLPRTVVFHDSFGPYLADFLPFFFERTVLFWQYQPSLEVVAQEEPDVVIQEIGERVLIRDELKGGDVPFPLDERIRRDFERRRAFRAATFVSRSEGSGPSRIGAGDGPSLVRLDVYCTQACTVRLGSASAPRPLVRGRNVVYLDLDEAAAELVFEPDGSATVRSAEVRVVTSGADG